MKEVIITFSGFHYFITKEQSEKLKNLPLNATIDLEEGSINTKSIAEVVTEEKYYERYPDKRPHREPTNFSKLEQPKQTYSESKRKKRLSSMQKGFLKGVAKKREVGSVTYEDLKPHQKDMYDKMQEALDGVERGAVPEKFVMGRDNN